MGFSTTGSTVGLDDFIKQIIAFPTSLLNQAACQQRSPLTNIGPSKTAAVISRLYEALGIRDHLCGGLESPTQRVLQHPYSPIAGNSFQLLCKEPRQEVFVLTGSSPSGSVKL